MPLNEPAVPAWLDRLTGVSWRFLVVAGAAMVIISGLVTLDVILLPMFLALLFASACVAWSAALASRLPSACSR